MTRDVHDSTRPRRRLVDWIACEILVFVAGANLFTVIYLVPRLRLIFNDMYGREPLPFITTLILQGRYVFGILAVAYAVAGVLIFVRASGWTAFRWVWGLIGVAVIQLGFVICVLFLPLAGIIIQPIRP